MFGADVGHLSMLDAGPRRDTTDADSLDYLIPKFHQQYPWIQDRRSLGEDFILIAEFSEQEGPRPVLVIPKDGGKHFDQNEFSVKILAVDHQSSIVEGCHMTEDAQVIMSDSEQGAHAFIHHIVLNDIQARGYVRPFCITYVTSDQMKIMKCYEKLSSQLKEVARLMKFGNRLVFMRDLEKRLEDLDYTKTQLLISQSSSRAQSNGQGDSELLQTLNTIRQCMEEVRDIMANLKTQLMDKELEERFQVYERRLKSRHHHTSETESDCSSLKDFSSSELSTDGEMSGSFSFSPEFSLFSKSKDLKPKLLDVSAIGGKRRFDRSLRGLHELCSWGAKEGLQKLRMVSEILKRDLSSIVLEDFDLNMMSPDAGVLSFGYNSIGANFLSACDSSRDSCCLKRKRCGAEPHLNHISSFGSFDSFKSLPSSYQSLLDEDTMYSVNSSVQDTSSAASFFDRQNSEDFGLTFNVDDVNAAETRRDFESTIRNSSSLSGTVTTDSPEHLHVDTAVQRDGRGSALSEFENITIERDLVCNAKGCSCKSSSAKGTVEHKHETESRNGAIKVKDGKEVTDSLKLVKGKDADEQVFCMCNETDEFELSLESDSRLITVGMATVCIECKQPKIVLSSGVGEVNSVNTSISDIISVDSPSAKMTESTSTLTDSTTLNIGASLAFDNRDTTQTNFQDIPDQNGEDLTDSFEDDRETPQPKLNGDTICDIIPVIDEQTESDTDETSDTHKDIETDIGNKYERTSHMTSAKSIEVQNKDTRRLSESSVNTHYGSKPEGVERDIAHRHSISGSSSSMLDSTEVRLLYGREPAGSYSGQSSQDSSIMRQLNIARKRLKWTSHGFSMQADQSTVHCVQKTLTSYNNLHHVVSSLLSRKPVIVIATERHEASLKELVKAISVFTPVTQGGLSISLVCQVKQLKIAEVRKFQIRGIIRSDRRAVDFLVPSSLRRYVTLVDLDKMLVSCQPYQGSLLHFLGAIYHKRLTFKSEQALFTYVQLQLQEISTKAFTFYHNITSADKDSDFSGTTLPRKSSMLELSAEKYLSRGGHLSSDCRIIKHLSELVKIQQIDEEFKAKCLTDAPVCPFAVAYQSVQTYRM